MNPPIDVGWNGNDGKRAEALVHTAHPTGEMDKMPDEKLTVAVSADRTVTALMTRPEGESSGWLFMYAPGAGSNVHDPFGAHASHRLAAEGFSSVRFQFPYMEDGRRRPS